jgi:hypothetical protein
MVGGVTTTRYQATVDLVQALETAPESRRWRLSRRLRSCASPQMSATVWLDPQGRVRRLIFHRLRLPQRGPLRLWPEHDEALELYDFGTEIRLVPPPRNSVEMG